MTPWLSPADRRAVSPSPSAADVLSEPVLVGRAIGTTVVKAELQRKERTADQ